MKREQPFYLHLRPGEVLTCRGDIPLRVNFVEGRGAYSIIGLAVDPPASGEIEFDAKQKILTRNYCEP